MAQAKDAVASVDAKFAEREVFDVADTLVEELIDDALLEAEQEEGVDVQSDGAMGVAVGGLEDEDEELIGQEDGEVTIRPRFVGDTVVGFEEEEEDAVFYTEMESRGEDAVLY